jgi:hypothetical protein
MQGTKSKMGYYDADGKQTGSGTSEVTKVYTNGDSTVAIINSTFTSVSKPDAPHASEMKIACVKDAFVMDMGGMMNSMMPQQPGHEMKMVCTGNMVGYKSSYIVGEKLDDINMTMEMFSNGTSMMVSTIKITDRKVEAYADIVVPAGTFKCYKISYNTTSDTKMHGMSMPAQPPHKSVMYYYPKAGMIRMEQYKDDKIFSYSELLELTKP